MARPRPVPPYCRVAEAVRLRKRLKNDGLFLFGDADPGIRNRKVKHDTVVLPGFLFDGNIHFTLFREFDGVPDQG